jgi:serine protein kinase
MGLRHAGVLKQRNCVKKSSQSATRRDATMATNEKSFADLISTDREQRAEDNWSGNFLDYLELLRTHPDLPVLAHRRIYNALVAAGSKVLTAEDDPRIGRLFGDDGVKIHNSFRDIFFGIEPVVDHIVRYFHAAALKGEESRQVLYLMGPVGAGKSSIVDHIHSLLENSPAMMAIEGCPIHEEPLHLTPRHLREQFSEMLDVHIEGDLCPVCRYRLKEEYGEEYENMRVVAVRPSKRARRAIAVVPPVDPNNQGVQKRNRISAYHDHRYAGKTGARTGTPWHGLCGLCDYRPLERVRMAQVQGRPY